MPFGIGVAELLILLVILLVIFGAKRLPEIGRGLGSSAREFRDGLTGNDEEPPRVGERGEAISGPPDGAETRQTAGERDDPR